MACVTCCSFLRHPASQQARALTAWFAGSVPTIAPRFATARSEVSCLAPYLQRGTTRKPTTHTAPLSTRSAKNEETQEKVAIKKISNAFDNATDARRTLREIKLLRHLRHENIVALKDILRPHSQAEFNDVYLVYAPACNIAHPAPLASFLR